MTTTTHARTPVSIRGLSKSFGKGEGQVHALVDVSLDVGPGEQVAIIGPSGSGKSTLLHVAAGLTRPDSGQVMVDGQDLAVLNDRRLTLFRRKHIGMVFQGYNLIPTLTVEENLIIPLLLSREDARVAELAQELLDMLGLCDRRRHRPDQLSGGEQQRVAFGRAMITQPTVILADEPTGNLDSHNSRKLCELLRRLCRDRGRAIVTVTHDPAVAIWADRVMVLKDGRMLQTMRTGDFASSRDLGAAFLEILERSEEARACV